MNNRIKCFLRSGAVFTSLSITSVCHADMNQVMALINTPANAPVVKRCEGNINCNAFVAISKQWQIIPKGDRLRYFIYSADLNAMIREGKDLKEPKLMDIDDFAYQVFDYHAENGNDRWLYVKGLAVLKYVQRTQFSSQ
ncbi:hypothetical protein F896_00988 [Acinetobacter genomosp. 15BJ]|uniref:Uncharacterized protein n=1 Tax=Acinetobacter genomosp. 15BJ TaxID=106651 RepID=R9BAT9_9GAMM|nr:hypothetical protein [Acinetobacter genomosp. 15BJ]EOR09496.1 hypothetical protein F896_00988 [Acinetobacter genomosp. 15BJ]